MYIATRFFYFHENRSVLFEIYWLMCHRNVRLQFLLSRRNSAHIPQHISGGFMFFLNFYY